MIFEKRRNLGMGFRRLSFMGDGFGGADHLDVVARDTDAAEALSAILEYVDRTYGCDLIAFDNLAAASKVAAASGAFCRQGGNRFTRFSTSTGGLCPHIKMDRGWNTILAESKRGDNFRRKLKKLERLEGFEFRSVTGGETSAAFERFLSLHNARWQERGGSEMTGHPRLVQFQRNVVERLSRAGLVRFDELWVQGKCVGSVYGLDDAKVFYYYNAGYDAEYSNLSVGLVLLGLSVKSAADRGIALYDFLRGDEGYKFDWANGSREIVNIKISDDRFAMVADEVIGGGLAKIRGVVKAIMPSAAVETVANLRRSVSRNYQMSNR